MAFPFTTPALPTLTGGAGGDSSATTRGANTFAPAYGAFNVGGSGISQGGATASASAAENGLHWSTWLMIGLGVLAIMLQFRRGSRR